MVETKRDLCKVRRSHHISAYVLRARRTHYILRLGTAGLPHASLRSARHIHAARCAQLRLGFSFFVLAFLP